MGAETFIDAASGDNAQDAFNNAVDAAIFEYGHAPYSGTISEKDSFVMIDLPDSMKPEEYAEHLISNDDPRIDDKWGPAGCIDMKDGKYLFFGWASS